MVMHLPQPLAGPPEDIHYPDSDGKPLADNTKQLDWIMLLTGNLKILFEPDPKVFVSSDQLWYPVRGRPDIRQAPDVYVVFGRPKGHRGSWKQWEELDTPMTVVFEILSPGNSPEEMVEKFHFYDDYGVEEYYTYDPDDNDFRIYIRGRATLVPRHPIHRRFTSPRLGVPFDWSGNELKVLYPDGRPFLSMIELDQERIREATARQQAEAAWQQAEVARQQAEAARQQAEAERQAEMAARQQAEAERQAEITARQQAEVARQQAEAERQAEMAARQQAEVARQQAEVARQQAEVARQQAEAERQAEMAARQQAEADHQAEAAARAQMEARLARLAYLASQVAAGTASPEELGEWQQWIGAN
jgi:Uma2 family endonuclease